MNMMRASIILLSMALSGCLSVDWPSITFPRPGGTDQAAGEPEVVTRTPAPPVAEPISPLAAFDEAYALTKRSEGGLVVHKNDRGGMTYFGIARRHWPNWYGWSAIDAELALHNGKIRKRFNQDMAAIVKDFYQENFWHEIEGDAIAMVDRDIAIMLFDIAVNQSPRTAGCFLQGALNGLNRGGRDYPDLVMDCRVGDATVKAMTEFLRVRRSVTIWVSGQRREISGRWVLYAGINVQKWQRWAALVANDPTQESFANGWTVRGIQDIVTALDRAGVIR